MASLPEFYIKKNPIKGSNLLMKFQSAATIYQLLWMIAC